jgi:hypothetical protein
MKNDILWDAILYSSLTFRKLLASCWLLVHLTLRRLIGRRCFPPKRRPTSGGVQVVISQKKILLAKRLAFITYQTDVSVRSNRRQLLSHGWEPWSTHAAPLAGSVCLEEGSFFCYWPFSIYHSSLAISWPLCCGSFSLPISLPPLIFSSVHHTFSSLVLCPNYDT